MDKPKSLSVKDYLIRKTAPKIMIPESTLDAVISHNYKYLYNLMDSKTEVEIVGFGRLYFNTNKARKTLNSVIKKLEKEPSNELLEFKKNLEAKINQHELLTNSRRVEK